MIGPFRGASFKRRISGGVGRAGLAQAKKDYSWLHGFGGGVMARGPRAWTGTMARESSDGS
jgi:hypothetical protein